MNSFSILAASYLGPEGFGNNQTGLRTWPLLLAEELQRGKLDGLHWSLLSDSDPSRFLRMDLMCRLGFMATELLDANFDEMPTATRDHTGVCVESFSGSLDTDIRFAQTPRPSIFAYTLPSTIIGEICIRFRLKGPVLSLVSPVVGGADAVAEAAEWLRDNDVEMVLCFSIEAMNLETANSISLSENLRPPGWHAAALLIGRKENSRLAQPSISASLVQHCRNLCFTPKRAC